MPQKFILLAFTALLYGMIPETSNAQMTPMPQYKAKSAKQRVQTNQTRRNHTFTDFGQEYTDFKNMLNEKFGIDYSVDVSFMPQWGAPNGEHNANQTLIYPSLTWTMFNNEHGTGTLNVAYNIATYGNFNANQLGSNINTITGINDYTDSSNSFDELYFSYQFGGNLSWLTMAIGQFPIYNFDGSEYNSNQQENFINYALSQNASSTYPTAGIGTYAQITPNENWSFAIGAQDATNVTGSGFKPDSLDEKHYTTFGYAAYTPTISGLGDGQYSILLYNQPAVDNQPETTNGWSLNLSQNIGEKWNVFARINGVSGNTAEISNSYVLGAVYNNPLDRNPLDQIGFAAAYNKIDEDAVGEPLDNSHETVLEAYWAWGVSKWMTITPDIQLYLNPATSPKSDTATVMSLRATLFF